LIETGTNFFDSPYLFGANVAPTACKVCWMKFIRTFKCYNAWAFRCKECFFAKGTNWSIVCSQDVFPAQHSVKGLATRD